jgi:hypothetical protein
MRGCSEHTESAKVLTATLAYVSLKLGSSILTKTTRELHLSNSGMLHHHAPARCPFSGHGPHVPFPMILDPVTHSKYQVIGLKGECSCRRALTSGILSVWAQNQAHCPLSLESIGARPPMERFGEVSLMAVQLELLLGGKGEQRHGATVTDEMSLDTEAKTRLC